MPIPTWELPGNRSRFCPRNLMGVSMDMGVPPKWVVYKGRSNKNGWLGGTPILGNLYMLHGAGIFTNICPKNCPNVCKHSMELMGLAVSLDAPQTNHCRGYNPWTAPEDLFVSPQGGNCFFSDDGICQSRRPVAGTSITWNTSGLNNNNSKELTSKHVAVKQETWWFWCEIGNMMINWIVDEVPVVSASPQDDRCSKENRRALGNSRQNA